MLEPEFPELKRAAREIQRAAGLWAAEIEKSFRSFHKKLWASTRPPV